MRLGTSISLGVLWRQATARRETAGHPCRGAAVCRKTLRKVENRPRHPRPPRTRNAFSGWAQACRRLRAASGAVTLGVLVLLGCDSSTCAPSAEVRVSENRARDASPAESVLTGQDAGQISAERDASRASGDASRVRNGEVDKIGSDAGDSSKHPNDAKVPTTLVEAQAPRDAAPPAIEPRLTQRDAGRRELRCADGQLPEWARSLTQKEACEARCRAQQAAQCEGDDQCLQACLTPFATCAEENLQLLRCSAACGVVQCRVEGGSLIGGCEEYAAAAFACLFGR